MNGVQCETCGAADQHPAERCEQCRSIEHVKCDLCDGTGLVEVQTDVDRAQRGACECAHGDQYREAERLYGRG